MIIINSFANELSVLESFSAPSSAPEHQSARALARSHPRHTKNLHTLSKIAISA